MSTVPNFHHLFYSCYRAAWGQKNESAAADDAWERDRQRRLLPAEPDRREGQHGASWDFSHCHQNGRGYWWPATDTGFRDIPKPLFFGKPDDIGTLVRDQRRNEERSEVWQQWFSKMCYKNQCFICFRSLRLVYSYASRISTCFSSLKDLNSDFCFERMRFTFTIAITFSYEPKSEFMTTHQTSFVRITSFV